MDNKKKYILFILSTTLIRIGSGIIPFLIILLNKEFINSDNYPKLIYILVLLMMIPAIFLGARLEKYISKKNIIISSRLIYISSLLLYIIFNYSNVIKLNSLFVAFFMIGISNPSINTILVDNIEEKSKKLAYSLNISGIAISNIIAPLITGFFIKNVRFLFFIYMIFVLLGLIILFFINDKHKINKKEIVIEKEKLNILKFDFLIISLLIIIFEISFSQQNFSLPLMFEKVFKKNSEIYFGYILSINAIVNIIFAPLSSKILKNIKSIKLVSFASLFCAFGFFSLILFKNKLELIILSVILWSTGEVLYTTYMFFALIDLKICKNTSASNTLILIYRSVGMVLGVIIASYLENKFNLDKMWIFIFFISILGFCLAFRYRRE